MDPWRRKPACRLSCEIPQAGDKVRTHVGEFEVLAMDGYGIDTLAVRLDRPA